MRSSAGDVSVDVYSNALAVGCVLMMAGSLVVALRDELMDRSLGGAGLVAARWQLLPADFLWMSMTYLALVGITVTARRAGPVTVSRAQAAWWLPLPVDRLPMVLPPFRRRLVLVGAAASLAYAPFSVLTALDRSPWAHVGSAVTFGAGALLAVTAAAVLQLTPGSSPAHRAAVAVGLLPVAVLPLLAPAVWPLVVSLAAAGVAVAWVLPRIGGVPGTEVQRGGAVTGHAAASVFLLDVNELRRALAGGPRAGTSRRGARFYARPTRWAVTAVVRADVVAFLRLQPAPVGPLVWLGLCLAASLSTPALPVPVQLGVILVAGCATAAGTGTVARRTAVITELDLLLPLSPVLVRCSRMLMPAVGLAVWMSVLTAAFVAVSSAPVSLVLLGAIAGLGMGAGAVRAAARPATDWTTPPVETPFGAVPRDQASSLLRGTDTTALAMIPVLVALYLGTVHPWLVLAQLVATSIALTVQASTPPSR
ncbi:DUF6297 family protein [Arthrobacter antioxidans]|uniref:DUF6297 family protein n=1 Tax=Arthrobacter antioxidans TaxID=2895818 RepID=UPI001FFE8786|nr:DUF6297 family protein [Arthrobacter antioxidans]